MKPIKNVYFDHAAAAPINPTVLEYVKNNACLFYNPSAYYKMGQYNKAVIEYTREKIAKEINCSPEEIYFTSGASESNALAISSFLTENRNSYVYATPIEHSSILNHPEVEPSIHVTNQGRVLIGDLKKMVKDGHNLFCIGHANNEIGFIQDIKKISAALKGDAFLVDAAQTFGKVKIDVQDMGIDYLSASAGKIGGLRGTGFLYVRKGMPIFPLIHGTQENGMRGGTYFDLGITAFGKAIDSIDYNNGVLVANRRNYMFEQLNSIKNVKVISQRANTLPGHVLFQIKDTSLTSQQVVGLFDEAGFMVSSGSACHAGENKPSHVLKALGYKDEDIQCVIRVTLGIENTKEEIDSFIECLKNILFMAR